jgi:lysozyme family protein
MTPNVRSVIDRVLLHEGGVADVGDGKGITRYGQTPDWLAQWSLPVPENAEQARENYATWMDRLGLNVVCDVSLTLGASVVDYAVHSGHGPAVKALQRAFGITADGIIGDETRRFLLASAPSAMRRLTLGVHAARIEHLGRLITDKPSNAVYAAGWMVRMAKNLRDDLV